MTRFLARPHVTTFREGSDDDRRNSGQRATTACIVDSEVEEVATSYKRRLYREGGGAEGTGIERERDVGRVIR